MFISHLKSRRYRPVLALSALVVCLTTAGSMAVFAGPPADAGATTAQPTTTAAPMARTTAPPPKSAPVYDEKADVKQLIAEALVKAKKDNQRVLVQWGANWCGWCNMLHGLYKSNNTIAMKLMYEYQVVYADIGNWNKNIDLAASYGADVKKFGVPYLTVLDADGKVLANQETGALELKNSDKPGHDPAKVLAFLTQHQAPYLSADSVLGNAIQEAKVQDKMVFLHFGAPWCPWCHKLENWMAQPEIAQILGKEFVEVKIDTDRMTGGADMLKTYTNGKETGIPWFVFMDPATGKVVADSNGPKGNVGFPVEDFEIAHFAKMLASANGHLSADDVNRLVDSLKASAAKIKAVQQGVTAQQAPAMQILQPGNNEEPDSHDGGQ